MKAALILGTTALILSAGCADKKPHKKNVFIFQNVRDGKCDVDTKLSHWDAKTGAMVLVCKS